MTSNLSWNYRVVFFKGREGLIEDYYAIQEVYYEGEKPVAYCDAEAVGDSVDELQECLDRMMKAAAAPVLNADDMEEDSGASILEEMQS
jgi:hypothetical protein